MTFGDSDFNEQNGHDALSNASLGDGWHTKSSLRSRFNATFAL